MSELNSILDKIKEQKAILKIEVEAGTGTARNMADRQKNAKNRIEGLKVDYRNALLERTVFIVMYGEGSDDMASLAEKEFGSFAAGADVLVDRIVNLVPEVIYMGKQTSPSLFEYVSHILEGVAAEAGVSSFPYPIYKASKYSRRLASKGDLKTLVTQILCDEVGSELVAVHSVTATFLKALDTEFDGKIYPLVLYTDSVGYAKSLVKDIKERLKRDVFTITSGDTQAISKETISLQKVDKASMQQALTEIKNVIAPGSGAQPKKKTKKAGSNQ